ncbi:exported hypothetical protein [Paraburkholderia ribeironis]|uniref:Uncharacterized protein n=1 Tax=Paraburkholderia ribeironis TaxID=1247936 RepID=A0A1N7RZD7_9BURK|nr:exported hypothetical protein [Paraburkholderia ribeironis]
MRTGPVIGAAAGPAALPGAADVEVGPAGAVGAVAGASDEVAALPGSLAGAVVGAAVCAKAATPAKQRYKAQAQSRRLGDMLNLRRQKTRLREHTEAPRE